MVSLRISQTQAEKSHKRSQLVSCAEVVPSRGQTSWHRTPRCSCEERRHPSRVHALCQFLNQRWSHSKDFPMKQGWHRVRLSTRVRTDSSYWFAVLSGYIHYSVCENLGSFTLVIRAFFSIYHISIKSESKKDNRWKMLGSINPKWKVLKFCFDKFCTYSVCKITSLNKKKRWPLWNTTLWKGDAV